jgi:hypothetical protein
MAEVLRKRHLDLLRFRDDPDAALLVIENSAPFADGPQ